MIEILTPEELADLVRLSPNKIILLARRRELPFVILDGKIRFDAQDVEDWINARKIGSMPAPPRVVSDIDEIKATQTATDGKARKEASVRKYLANEIGGIIANVGTAKKSKE